MVGDVPYTLTCSMLESFTITPGSRLASDLITIHLKIVC